MEKNGYHFNTTKTAKPQATRETDIHIIIIVVVLIVVILLVLAAILVRKYVSKLASSWRQQRSEEALTRAINIYNSQEPLEEPDLVYITPGDHSEFRSPKGNRRESEIAFVHSDGRIERFRPLLNAGNARRPSSADRMKPSQTSETRLTCSESHHCNVTSDQEAYVNFQPLCVKLDSISAQIQGSFHGDAVSLGGFDMPPSYEEALDMPAASINGTLNKSDSDLAIGGSLDYCNIETGKQCTGSQRKNVNTLGIVRSHLPFRPADRNS